MTYWTLIGFIRPTDCTCPRLQLAVVVLRGSNLERSLVDIPLGESQGTLPVVFTVGVAHYLDPEPQLIYSTAPQGGMSRTCGTNHAMERAEDQLRVGFRCRCGQTIVAVLRGVEVPLARPAPRLELLPPEQEVTSLLVPMSASRSSLSDSGARHEVMPRFLILPGNYSGDSWACAAAMLLDPSIHVVVTMKDDESADEGGDYDGIAKQFLQFARSIGIERADERIHVSSGGLGQQGSAGAVASQAEKVISRVCPSGNPICGWTFSSTSVLMHYAERHGVEALRRRLIEAFTQPNDRYAELVRAIAEFPRCVLLNMRIGRRGNHPQHNMTQGIYQQLLDRARAAGLHVVRVGTYQDGTWTPEGQWMADLDDGSSMIDLFPRGERATRQHVAWFWSRVALLSNVVGVIGGRSGSLDVAAFMGMNTLCWDIVQADDAGHHEYVRQLLMFPLMSICARQVGKRLGSGHYYQQDKPSPSGILDESFVRLWLAGQHIIPSALLNPRVLTSCGTLSGGLLKIRGGLLLQPLRYAQSIVATLNERAGTLTDPGSQRELRIQEVVGDGDCLFHAIAAAGLFGLPSDANGLRAEVVRRLRESGDNAAAARIEGTDMVPHPAVDTIDLDAIGRVLGVRFVLYEAYYGADAFHVRTTHNDTAMVSVALLLRSIRGQLDGHYDPLV